MHEPTENRGYYPVASLVGSLLLYALILANATHPTLRFESARLNLLFFELAQLLPILSAVAVFRLSSRKVIRFLVWITISPVLAIAGINGLFVSFDMIDAMKDGIDPSFERISCMDVPNSRLCAYRTDGGATTSYGIEVRAERVVFPGLLVVKPVFTSYPAHDVSMKQIGSGLVEVASDKGDAKIVNVSTR